MRRAALVVAMVAAVLPWSIPAQAGAATGLSIGTSSSYVDAVGLTHVVGFLQDDGPDVEAAQVTVTYLDATGRSLGSGLASVMNDVIRTGEKSPFDYPFKAPAGYASYTLSNPVANHTVVVAHRDGVVTVTKSDKSGASPYVIQGTVKNTSQESLLAAKIEVIFLDDAGITRWVAGTIAVNARNNFDLAPGASASWFVPFKPDAPATWTHYVTLAETPVFSGDLQAAAAATKGIAAVPTVPDRSLHLGTLGHAPVQDAPAVAPSSPLPDERKARVAPAADPDAGTSTTVASTHTLGKPLTWSALVVPVLGAGGVLLLMFLITLAFLAVLRLRATDPGRPRV